MLPVLFTAWLPSGQAVSAPAYGICLVAGVLAAALGSGRLARALGLVRRDVLDLWLVLVPVGVVGARLAHVAANPSNYFHDDGFVAALVRVGAVWTGGLASYGAVVTGGLVLLAWARRRSLPPLEVLDFAAPLGLVALAFARVGCFLNGCCFGAPTELPWAVVYPTGSFAHVHQMATGLVARGAPAITVHPVQLYEAALAIFLALILARWFERRRFAGEITLLFLLAYGTWRLFAESIRAEATASVYPIAIVALSSLATVTFVAASTRAASRTIEDPARISPSRSRSV